MIRIEHSDAIFVAYDRMKKEKAVAYLICCVESAKIELKTCKDKSDFNYAPYTANFISDMAQFNKPVFGILD